MLGMRVTRPDNYFTLSARTEGVSSTWLSLLARVGGPGESWVRVRGRTGGREYGEGYIPTFRGLNEGRASPRGGKEAPTTLTVANPH